MKFNFEELNYDTVISAVDAVKKNKRIEDYIGSIYVGKLQINMVLKKGFGESTIIAYEVYAGGIDSGYGYTTEGNLPYDFVGTGILINSVNVTMFQSYEDFKRNAINSLLTFIEESSYFYDGMNLMDIAKDNSAFSWE